MDMQRPPADYVTLTEAMNKPPSALYNVIGVCVDHLPAAKSRGTDYTATCVLNDPSWNHSDRGMKFRFFNKKIGGLPRIQNNGDIVILQRVATKPMNGIVGISNFLTSWVVLSGPSVIDSTCPNGSDIQYLTSAYDPAPSTQILQYAKHIVGYTDPGSFRTLSKATALQVDEIIKESGGQPSVRPGKRRLLQDLGLSKTMSGKFVDGKPAFADLFGEVRRMHKGDYMKVELYLTDYTSNSSLYNYDADPQSRDGDEYGYSGASQTWPGPWGKMTIHVACWDAHATFARLNLHEGMYVLIKNCQIKLDPNGSRLEAACRGDRDDVSQVNIVIFRPHEAVNDTSFKDLLKRKRDYEKLAVQKGLCLKEGAENGSKKRPPQSLGETVDAEMPKKMSKTERKRLRRNGKKQAVGEVITADATTVAGLQSNQNVRCNNVDVPPKAIDTILDMESLRRITAAGNAHFLPFQNCRYKAKVRVVDFFPDNIADFAVPRQSSQYDVLSDCEDDDDGEALMALAQSNPGTVDWEWRFMLIVEDANFQPLDANVPKKQMPLLVAGGEAEFLLRLTACDLKNNHQELAKLREKLFLLWGDLQERMEDAGMRDTTRAVKAQSKPFECLIHEYGVPMVEEKLTEDGMGLRYQRMFKMYGTTI